MLRIVLVSLLTVGCACQLEGAPCSGVPSSIFVVNGISTTSLDLELALDQIDRMLTQSLGCDLSVVSAWNDSDTAFGDFEESTYQWLEQRGVTIDDEAVHLLIRGVISPRDAIRNAQLASDLVAFFATRLSQNIVDDDNLTSERRRVLNAQEGQYRLALGLPPARKVIILGHSQGNFFANRAYDELVQESPERAAYIDVIGVDTPANRVAGRADPPAEYTILRTDPILLVPDNLQWNATAEPLCVSDPQLALWRCHLLGSYLNNIEPWSRIRFHLASSAERVARDDRFEMLPDERRSFSVLDLQANDRVTGIVPLGLQIALVGATDPRISFSSQWGTIDVDLTRQESAADVIFDYQYVTVFGRSNVARVTIVISGTAPGNQAPTAAFSMSSGSQLVQSPGLLSVPADAESGEARVVLQDRSQDPDGLVDITFWDWTVDGYPDSICTGTPRCEWGFRPGAYKVRLTIRDSAEHKAVASATILVGQPPPVILEVEPAEVTADPLDRKIVVHGSRYAQGITVVVRLPDRETRTLSGTQILDVADDRIDALATFADEGTYELTVVNPDGNSSAPFTLTVGAPRTRWPLSGRDMQRRGLASYRGPDSRPAEGRGWVLQTNAAVVGDLVVSRENRLYFVSDKLYAVNADGSMFKQAVAPEVNGQPGAFLTGPAIDDENDTVYVGQKSPSGGWDMVRYDKSLTTPVVVLHGLNTFFNMGTPIADRGSVFFFVRTTSAVPRHMALGK